MFLKKPPPTSYVISSPLQGTLLKDGKPLANTRIVRKLRWNGNEDGMEQEFRTDDEGRFSLPEHEEVLSLGALTQFVGKTDILVEGEEHIWFSSKTVNGINSEYESTPQNLICDLNNSEIGVNITHGTCLTKCRWDNMPEEDDPNEL